MKRLILRLEEPKGDNAPPNRLIEKIGEALFLPFVHFAAWYFVKLSNSSVPDIFHEAFWVFDGRSKVHM